MSLTSPTVSIASLPEVTSVNYIPFSTEMVYKDVFYPLPKLRIPVMSEPQRIEQNQNN